MELLAKLGINWQLLIAQLVNFVLLMVVLGYFVYKPFLKLLDDRRARVKKAMDDAKAMEDQKREMDHYKQQHMRKVDQDAAALLEEARKHAESIRKELSAKAEQDAHDIVERAKAQILEEKQKMMAELQTSMGSLVVKLTEKVLQEQLSDDVQKRVLGNVQKSLTQMLQ